MPKAPEAPFVWHMATVCLDLPYGAVKHIPAGNYHAQMSTRTGMIEFELMRLVRSVWYAFKYLKRGEWKKEQTDLMDWIIGKPPQIPPTRRMDALIAHVWRADDWTMTVIEKMRRYDDAD